MFVPVCLCVYVCVCGYKIGPSRASNGWHSKKSPLSHLDMDRTINTSAKAAIYGRADEEVEFIFKSMARTSSVATLTMFYVCERAPERDENNSTILCTGDGI